MHLLFLCNCTLPANIIVLYINKILMSHLELSFLVTLQHALCTETAGSSAAVMVVLSVIGLKNPATLFIEV